MPVDKKVMFSVLLLCAGVLGYWIEVAMGYGAQHSLSHCIGCISDARPLVHVGGAEKRRG